MKADGLPNMGATVWPPPTAERVDHPYWDRDGVHEIYRGWRALADAYEPPRVFVAEAWVHNPQRLALYVRPDELHTAFNFEFLLAPWRADTLREAIVDALDAHESVGAPPTWVLSNHDTVREVSRYARPQDDGPVRRLEDLDGLPADFDLGRRRARAAALLMLALPGGAYVYQGEELGLAEVEDLPDEVLQDPGLGDVRSHRAGPRRVLACRFRGRARAPPFGFSPNGASAPPWLPQPAAWAALTVRGAERRRELDARALPPRADDPA